MSWTHVYRCNDAEAPDMKKWGAGTATIVAYDSNWSPEEIVNRGAAIVSGGVIFRYIASFSHEPSREELDALETNR